jgi:hypothetical protein
MAQSMLRDVSVRVRPIVALCAGKDCRRRCETAEIEADLRGECTVIGVNCVGICSGPVVVAHGADDRPLVFSKVRSKKERRALLRLIVDGERPASSLAKREVRGGKRKSTIRKVDRRLRRSA